MLLCAGDGAEAPKAKEPAKPKEAAKPKETPKTKDVAKPKETPKSAAKAATPKPVKTKEGGKKEHGIFVLYLFSILLQNLK